MICLGKIIITWPGGDDTKRVIDLHRVGIDDDAVLRLRHLERQRRLAACSRTRYQHRTPATRHALFPRVMSMPVLCLIANPNDSELDPALAAAIAGQTGGELNWLNHAIACEIIEPKSTDALDIARQIIGQRRVDAAIVPTEQRRKQILIADMDSTMIEQECIDELAAALGIKEQVAEITDRAMRGELDLGQALDTRVALLKGLERKVVEQVRREQIT